MVIVQLALLGRGERGESTLPQGALLLTRAPNEWTLPQGKCAWERRLSRGDCWARLRMGHGREYCRGLQVLCSLHGPLINIHKRLCVFKMWRSGLLPASAGRGHGTAHVEWPSQLLWPEFLSPVKGGNWLEKSGRQPELKMAECSKFSASSPEENRGGLSRLFPER